MDLTKKAPCVNCGKRIKLYETTCPRCKTSQNLKILEEYAEERGGKLVDIECEKCGYDKSVLIDGKYSIHAECVKCCNTTFYNNEGKEELPFIPKLYSTARCPYCSSTRTKKISTTSKVASAALFGVFALGKVTKEWHCNNCKSDF